MPYALRSPRRTALALVVIAGLAVLLPSAGSAQLHAAKPTAAKAPINVLYVATESGALAAVGNAFLHGAVAAAHIINASGGILGHKVTLKIVDSNSNPATAVTLIQQQLGSGTKFTSVQTDNGLISGAITPILAQHPDILVTAATATAAQTVAACPNCYFSGPTQDTLAWGAVYWAHKLGYKSIGVLTVDNANGHSYAGYFKTRAAQYGMGYSDAFAPLGTLDGTPELQRVLANKPDVLVMPGSGAGPLFVPARAKLGTSVPVMCDQSCAGSTDWSSFTPDQTQGIKILTLPFLVLGDPSTKTFAYKEYVKYLERIESTHPLGFNAGLVSYENMMLMRAAAKRCNCVDGATWVKELETVTSSKKVAGWIGPTTLFSPSIHSLIYAPTFYTMVAAKPLVNGFWSK